ncbi:MAG: hypothetical protein ACI37Q_04490 [Candidatus Gastranaerophilaceae bacterium]
MQVNPLAKSKLAQIESCCCMGMENSRQRELIRKLRQLAAKLRRLMTQMTMAKTPDERLKIRMKIDSVMAEIAAVEREIKTG